MKSAFYRITAWFALLTFAGYWVLVFILSILGRATGQNYGDKLPRFSKVFGFEWSLFTPPYTYTNRLYFIASDTITPFRSDTLEVLENIALKKQHDAPFNEAAANIENLVHKSVSRLVRTVYAGNRKPDGSNLKQDSLLMKTMVAGVKGSASYESYLASLRNYGKLALEEHGIRTNNRSITLLIREQKMRPFKERSNPAYKLPVDILVYSDTFTYH